MLCFTSFLLIFFLPGILLTVVSYLVFAPWQEISPVYPTAADMMTQYKLMKRLGKSFDFRIYVWKCNGNSIFLPAASYRDGTEFGNRGSYGEYWSGSLNESYQGLAYYLFLGSGYRYLSNTYRESGYTVRPVCDK